MIDDRKEWDARQTTPLLAEEQKARLAFVRSTSTVRRRPHRRFFSPAGSENVRLREASFADDCFADDRARLVPPKARRRRRRFTRRRPERRTQFATVCGS